MLARPVMVVNYRKPNLLYLGIHQYSLSILPIYFYYLIYHLRGIVTILNMPR
jgi:hypothetical protein